MAQLEFDVSWVKQAIRSKNPDDTLEALRQISEECQGPGGKRVFLRVKGAVIDAAVDFDADINLMDPPYQQEVLRQMRAAAAILSQFPKESVPPLLAEALGKDVDRACWALRTIQEIGAYSRLEEAERVEIDGALKLLANHSNSLLKLEAEITADAKAKDWRR